MDELWVNQEAAENANFDVQDARQQQFAPMSDMEDLEEGGEGGGDGSDLPPKEQVEQEPPATGGVAAIVREGARVMMAFHGGEPPRTSWFGALAGRELPAGVEFAF